MRRRTGTVALAMLASILAGAARAQSADLADRLEPIRAEFDLPALAALVTTADHTVAIGAVGVRQAADATPVTTGDLWHLGSCTKSMTGTLAAILVEQGKIEWSTTVADTFGDEFDDINGMCLPITLEQLLCHRGGIVTDAPPQMWQEAWRERGTLREQRDAFVHSMLTMPPISPPGTEFAYSNQGVMIAGAMLERAWDAAEGVEGTSWEDLVTTQLFEPLGITTAGFGAPGTADTIAQPRGHRRPARPNAPAEPVPPGPRADNPPAISPAGRVHMSLEDWAKYIREHLRGPAGESDLLPREAWEHLHTDPFGERYAIGWGLAERPWGGQVITHSGSNTMWYCVVWASPDKGFAVLVTTNIGSDAAGKAADKAAGTLIEAFTAGQLGQPPLSPETAER